MILGLSHLFGESGDLDATAGFWTRHGWRQSLSFHLPVPHEKRSLLHNVSAERVALRYLVRTDRPGLPGIEFVRHEPASRATVNVSRLTLSLPGSVSATDQDGNRILSADGSTRVDLLTPDPSASREALISFGFTPAGSDGEVALATPMLSQRGVVVGFKRAPELATIPCIDDGGLNGMSFLIRDLDTIDARVPLVARQVFAVADGEQRTVAFFAGAGLLLEFLAVTRNSPEKPPFVSLCS